MLNDPTIAIATASDIPELLVLVNSAYRGEAAKKGWTHEADLIAGELRTDESTIFKIIMAVSILECLPLTQNYKHKALANDY